MTRLATIAAIAGAIAAVFVGPARAEEDDDRLQIDSIERIGIEALIDVTVRAAPKLARAKSDADIARGEAQAAKGIDDYKLLFDFTATRKKNAPVEGQPVQVIANEQYQGKLGIQKSLFTGGNLTFGVDASLIKEEFRVQEMAAAMGVRQSDSRASRAQAQFNFTQPLLRGFGRDIARADLEKAQHSMSAGELRAQVAAGELVRDVIEAYWELVHAAISLEVRKESLTSARKVLKETRASVLKGNRPRTDLQSAEYAMAVREEGVLNAEIALQDTALGLRRTAGLEIGPDSISLWPADLPDVGRKRFSVARSVRAGLRRNPGIRAVILDGKNASIDVRVAKNSKRPQLDVTLAAAGSSTASTFDEAISALSSTEEFQVTGGLTFSFDIGNNAAKGLYRAATGRNRSAKIGIEELRREVASSVVLTVHRIRAARKRAQVAAKARELAIANLRAERARFQAGRSSSRDLYERQGEIDDASLSRARALADYHQSVARLRALTGQILKDYNIEILK